jgi:hypothetical protein
MGVGRMITIQKATDMILERVDRIIEIINTPDFYQFLTDTGGDIETYRVYKEDGRIGIK